MASILLVDDEPLVVESLTLAMESKGHSVVTAGNGAEGLKRFGERAFDVVITDIIMPDTEGIETIREMKRRKPDAKIIAMSGGGRTGAGEFLKMARNLGATATLTKPIRLSDLFRTLNECLDDGGR